MSSSFFVVVLFDLVDVTDHINVGCEFQVVVPQNRVELFAAEPVLIVLGIFATNQHGLLLPVATEELFDFNGVNDALEQIGSFDAAIEDFSVF